MSRTLNLAVYRTANQCSFTIMSLFIFTPYCLYLFSHLIVMYNSLVIHFNKSTLSWEVHHKMYLPGLCRQGACLHVSSPACLSNEIVAECIKCCECLSPTAIRPVAMRCALFLHPEVHTTWSRVTVKWMNNSTDFPMAALSSWFSLNHHPSVIHLPFDNRYCVAHSWLDTTINSHWEKASWDVSIS